MPSNAYDEIVVKATDENLTSENWELVLNLCDKVNDESESGARAVVSSLLKRLAYRSPTVQLYSLSLAEALSKNCGESLHRELASRSFTQGLEKLITDRNTHEKVKRRGLYLVSLLTGEFETNPQLGLMEELYESLRAKGHNFEQIKEPLPPAMDDEEIRRKEEEELQKVLEMSLRDKGGRSAPTWETSGGSSSSSRPGPSAASIASPAVTEAPRHPSHRKQETIHVQQPNITVAQATSPAKGTSSSSSSVKSTPTVDIVTRVRALHPFEPTVAGELGFEKGDIIRVTDRAYEHWWRGQLKGRTGIFPVNYVEPLPDLTVDEIAREAEQEAAVFAQAANIDKLVEMLRAFDHSGESLADNEEIQELYRSSMALRPRIVKLIDKYSQKRAELVAMNENFVKARAVFDQMMEESLARHTGVYETRQQAYHPDSRASRGYNWDAGYEQQQQQQPGYGGYGVTSPYQASYPFPGQGQYQAYPPSGDPAYGYNDPRASVYGPPQMSQGQSQAYPPGDHNDPRASAYGPPQMSQGQSQAYPPGDHYAPGAQQPYGPSADTAPAGYPTPNVQSPPPSMAQPQAPASFSPYGTSQIAQGQPQAYPPGDHYAQAPNAQSYGPAPDGAPVGYPAPNAQSSPPLMAQPQTSTSYLQAQPQSQPQPQPQPQQQPQLQPQLQQQLQQQQSQPQVQPQPQPQSQSQLQLQSQPQFQPHAEVSM